MESALDYLTGLPPVWVYVGLALGAAVENVLPPVPADTFVVLGGFLSARGPIAARWVWFGTWSCNVAGALWIYAMGRRHGTAFFERGPGRRLLTARQMARVRRFYDRFGVLAILLTRFLPGLRAVVPAFAGVSHQPVLGVAIPLAVASAAWYGGLVWAGATAGRNVDAVLAALREVNVALLAVTLVVVVVLVIVWRRTRDHADDEA